MRSRGTHLARVLVGLLATTAATLALASPAGASVTCDRVSSPTGSDSAAGTVAAPFRTGQKLASSLSAGQTGCFRAGTFSGQISVSVPSVTLTSYPGERATLVGYFAINSQGTGATVTGLNIDGKGAVATPQISADNTTFSDNDVTNENTEICFTVGGAGYRPKNTVIEDNNIHNCGKLPASNGDHGIYISDATGTIVRGNWIHNNADFGVHIYPNGDNSLVTGNVIDSNGEGVIFAGHDGETSDNNVVEHNIITNSLVRQNVESYWGSGPVGSGNVARNNCIKGTSDSYYATANGSGIMNPQVGFTASSNLIADPQYVNQAAGDYRLQASSPCASILGNTDVPPATTTPPPPPSTTPPPAEQPPSSGTTQPPSSTPTSKPGKKKKRRAKSHRAKSRR